MTLPHSSVSDLATRARGTSLRSLAEQVARRPWWVLAALWVLFAIAAVVWLRLDNRFPIGPAAEALTRSLRVADGLAHPSFTLASRLAQASNGQPPLPYMAAAPLTWILGRGADAAALINLLWLALLLASVYSIVRGLFPSQHPALGLLATALTGLYPLATAALRVYDPALAVAALAAAAVWLLVASQGLSVRRYAVGFGVVLAAGVLSHVGFWALIFGPAAIVAGQALATPRPLRGSRRSSAPRRDALTSLGRRLGLAPNHLHLVLALLPALLAAPYYLSRGRMAGSAAAINPFWPFSTLDDALGGFLLLMLFLSSLHAAMRVIRPTDDRDRLAFGLPLAWFGAAFLLLPLVQRTPQPTQLLALLAPAAVLTVASVAAWLRSRRPTTRRVTAALAALIALAALVNAGVTAWGAPRAVVAALAAPPVDAVEPFAFRANTPLWTPGRALHHRWPPQSVKSQTAAIGQTAQQICGDQERCLALTLSCSPSLDARAFDYFLAQSQLGNRLTFQSLPASANFYYELWDADALLVPSPAGDCAAMDFAGPNEEARRVDVVVKALADPDFSARFRPFTTFALPNGGNAQVLRRVGLPLNQLDSAAQVAALEHILRITPDADAAQQALSLVFDQVGDPARALALREQVAADNPSDAQAHIALGDAYFSYDRLQDAILQYQAALKLAPNPAVLLKLAQVQGALGQFDDAERSLLDAVAQAPDDYVVQLALGQFYVARGRFADAATTLAATRRIDPQRYEAYLAQAEAQTERNDFTQAQEQFRLAQQAAPQNPEPVLAWADALAARRDFQQAMPLYDQAIALVQNAASPDVVIDAYWRWMGALAASDNAAQVQSLAETLVKNYPSEAAAHEMLADVYRRQGLDDQAVAEYERSLELAPQNAAARSALARLLADLGQLDEAQELINRGLALLVGRVTLLTTQADLFARGNQPAEAATYYDKALQLNPSYWLATAGLAQVYLERGQTNRALKTVDLAIASQPQEYRLHVLRGDALLSLGRREEALAAYRQAVNLAPAPLSTADSINDTLSQLYTHMGDLQLAARNLSAAEESYRRALSYSASYAPTQVGLARLALRRAGQEAAPGAAVLGDEVRFQQVQNALAQARQLDPNSVAARVVLGDLYRAYGRSGDAIAAYQEALALDLEQQSLSESDLAAARRQLYDLYLAAGRSDEVIAFYSDLLRQQPDSVSTLTALADAYLATGQSQAAVDLYDRFLARNRDNYPALIAQANTLRQLGDAASLQQALAIYQRVVRIAPAPRLVQAWVALADMQTSLGQTDDAEFSYRQAIQIIQDPNRNLELAGDTTPAYVGLGRLLWSLGQSDAANAVVKEALDLQPDNAALQILAGDLSRQAGRNSEALVAYRRAAELTPANAVAQTRLGDLFLQGDALAEAQGAYQAALDSDPTNSTALLGLARALVRSMTADAAPLTPDQTATLERAESLLRLVLDQADAPNRAAAQVTLGDALALQGRTADAADAYQAALLQNPENATAIEGLARTLLAGGDAEQAIANYQAAADAAATPELRARWLMALAAAYRSLGRTADAEQRYQALLADTPDDIAARLAYGDLFQTEERWDDAIAQYRLAVQAAPNDLVPSFRLGRTLLRVDRIDEAMQVAQAMLAASPSSYEPYLLAARVALAQDDPAAALASLRQAQTLAPTNSAALALIGDTYLTLSRPDDAAAAYEAATSLEPRHAAALLGLGRIKLGRGQLVDAEMTLRRAAAAAPSRFDVQAALGRTLLRMGRADEAIALLESVTAQAAPPADSLQDLADAYLAAGRVDEGLAIYRTRLDLDAEQQALLIGQALLNAGRNDEGLAELEAFVAAQPNSLGGLLALAQGYGQAGRAEQAIAAFQRAAAAAPDDLRVRVQQGNFLLSQARAEEAIPVFQAATALPAAAASADAEAVEPWQAWIGLARAYQQVGRYDEALQAAQAGQGVRADVAALALQIGDIQRSAGRNDEALAAFRQAVALGASVSGLTRQGALYLRLNNADQALGAFEQALAVDPSNADALLGLAQAYALRGGGLSQSDFANAETRLRRAAQLSPNSPAAPLALGELYLAYGRPEDAVVQYQAALALAPDDDAAEARLAEALLAAGRAEEALPVQEQRLQRLPDDRSVLLGLASIYRALARNDDAEQVYTRLLDRTPDDAAVEISLGDLYLQTGRTDQAVTLYQQAHSHANAANDVGLTAQASDQLGKAYLRQGRVDDALTVAQQLVQTQPSLSRGHLLLGSVYEAQGDLAAAVSAYQAGIGQVDDPMPLQLQLGEVYLRNDDPAAAQALYEALTAGNSLSVDAYVGLARAHIEQLPDLKALRFEWAMEALRAALRLDSQSTPALTAEGDLYMTMEQPGSAVDAYRAALTSRRNAGDASALRLKLASALAASEQWDAALQEYQRAAIANPGEIGVLMALGNAYQASGRVDQALAQYRAIIQLAPSYPFAYIKQGEILDARKQSDEALAAYQAAVTAAPDNASAQFSLAVAYRKRGRLNEAIAAYQAGLALDPMRDAARRAVEELRAELSAATPTP